MDYTYVYSILEKQHGFTGIVLLLRIMFFLGAFNASRRIGTGLCLFFNIEGHKGFFFVLSLCPLVRHQACVYIKNPLI